MSHIGHIYKHIGVGGLAFAMPFIALTEPAFASGEMTAGSVLTQMTTEERVAYLAGIVEGLAYARHQKDGSNDGMRCVYDWFYENEGVNAEIRAAFEHFSDYTPAAVIAAMVEEDCGE